MGLVPVRLRVLRCPRPDSFRGLVLVPCNEHIVHVEVSTILGQEAHVVGPEADEGELMVWIDLDVLEGFDQPLGVCEEVYIFNFGKGLAVRTELGL